MPSSARWRICTAHGWTAPSISRANGSTITRRAYCARSRPRGRPNPRKRTDLALPLRGHRIPIPRPFEHHRVIGDFAVAQRHQIAEIIHAQAPRRLGALDRELARGALDVARIEIQE